MEEHVAISLDIYLFCTSGDSSLHFVSFKDTALFLPTPSRLCTYIASFRSGSASRA